jgi:hypothetical protein
MKPRVALATATLCLAVVAGCSQDVGDTQAGSGAEPDAAQASGLTDGSPLETEPVLPVVATVLGDPVRAADGADLLGQVLTRLLDAYAAAEGIAATPSEVDAFVETMEAGMRESGLDAFDELTPEEAAQATAMRQEMGRSMILRWKINRQLYQQYGGRLIYQQLGPEPLDAYRQFLEERQAAGDFAITDASLEEAFWDYLRNESLHDFMEPGSEEAARAFTTPPWE